MALHPSALFFAFPVCGCRAADEALLSNGHERPFDSIVIGESSYGVQPSHVWEAGKADWLPSNPRGTRA